MKHLTLCAAVLALTGVDALNLAKRDSPNVLSFAVEKRAGSRVAKRNLQKRAASGDVNVPLTRIGVSSCF
jgi:hypothetical protein